MAPTVTADFMFQGHEHQFTGCAGLGLNIPDCRYPRGSLAAHVLGTGLSRYKRPREYQFVGELPRGNTGKLNRRALRERRLRDPAE